MCVLFWVMLRIMDSQSSCVQNSVRTKFAMHVSSTLFKNNDIKKSFHLHFELISSTIALTHLFQNNVGLLEKNTKILKNKIRIIIRLASKLYNLLIAFFITLTSQKTQLSLLSKLGYLCDTQPKFVFHTNFGSKGTR